MRRNLSPYLNRLHHSQWASCSIRGLAGQDIIKLGPNLQRCVTAYQRAVVILLQSAVGFFVAE